MKKLFVILALGLMSFTTNNTSKVNDGDCRYGRCREMIEKANGTFAQCKNCAQKDSYYCWTHNTY